MAEMLSIRMLNAVAAANGAPTLATDGIAIPVEFRDTPAVHLQGQFSRTSGSASFRLRLWGYRARMVDSDRAVIASSNAWMQINGGDTGVLTDSADWKESWVLLHLHGFTRLYVELVSISGTGAAVTAALGLESPDA